MTTNMQNTLTQGPRPPRGMTMMEAIVSVTIVAAMVLVVFQALATQGAVATENLIEIDLQSMLRRDSDELVNELTDARLIALDRYARWVEYNEPETGPSGAPLIGGDGKIRYGAVDFTGVFRVNGYYHLECVDEPADTIIINETTWGQNVDADLSGANTTLIFIPVRFELTMRIRDPLLVNRFMADGRAAGTNLGGGALAPGASQGMRVMTIRSYRDATPRLPAPFNTGEGIFYMRQRQCISGPLQTANDYTDVNNSGKYEVGEPVAPDIYGSELPMVYRGRYFEPDSYPFADANNNNVVDGLETLPGEPGAPVVYNLRICLIGVHSSETGGLARSTISGVKRVMGAQTIVKVRNY